MIIEKTFQLKLEHILPFLIFSGLFSLATYGMLLDVFSDSKYPTNWLRNPTISPDKIGIVLLLFATILDLIISIIHYLTTEKMFYKFGHELKKRNESLRALLPNCHLPLSSSYIFNDKDTDKHYCIKYKHCSIFYGKLFISLIPFAIVAYFDLPKKLEVPREFFLLFALEVIVIACACLKVSYEALLRYKKEKISLICKSLNPKYYIKLNEEPTLGNKSNKHFVKITIYETKSDKIIELRDLNVNLRTTLGCIIQKDNRSGHRVVILRSNKSGKAIITATAENCIPGTITVSYTLGVDKYNVFVRSFRQNPMCNNNLTFWVPRLQNLKHLKTHTIGLVKKIPKSFL